tara:strand:- start:292 stop:480 length:189 start_codon:yes stop_codon:yes gene_type:complete
MEGSLLDKVLFFFMYFVFLFGFFAFMDDDPNVPIWADSLMIVAIPISLIRWSATGKHFWHGP